MEDIKTVERKILLKRQAINVIIDEIRELKFRKTLLAEKGRLEKMMTEEFDPGLSLRIDGIVRLLEI